MNYYVIKNTLVMSTGADKGTASPRVSGNSEKPTKLQSSLRNRNREKDCTKASRKVSFPANDDQLVTQYFEAANPWQEGESLTWQSFKTHHKGYSLFFFTILTFSADFQSILLLYRFCTILMTSYLSYLIAT